MSRPRKNDPTGLIYLVLESFAKSLSATVEKFTVKRIENEVAHVLKNRKGGRLRRSRLKQLCYAPGCQNVAAPRFGMFCAAKHKDISKTMKKKWRQKYLESVK